MSSDSHGRLLRWGVFGLAAAAALISWLVTRDRGSSSPAPPEAPAARIVTPVELSEAEAVIGQPIYWVGSLAGKQLELKELGQSGVQVRYLPDGVEAGGDYAGALTIGSYRLPDPAAALRATAGRGGAIVRRASDGSPVVTNERTPNSAYLADPRNEVQIEVYDPSPAKAMSVARSSRLRPAG